MLLGKVPPRINRSQKTLVALKNNPDKGSKILGTGRVGVSKIVGAVTIMPRYDQNMRPLAAKDSDGNYLATCQAPETVENGLRPGAVDNFISITVLSCREIKSRKCLALT